MRPRCIRAIAQWISFLFSGLMFSLTWNFAMPVFWKGAPHVSYWVGVAVVLLIQAAAPDLFVMTWRTDLDKKEAK